MAGSASEKKSTKNRYIRKLGARSQVTIPKDIARDLYLQEGDQLSIVREKNYIVIEPVRVVPKNALYYRPGKDNDYITTADIEQAAAEAEKDYRDGKLKKYKSAEDMLIDSEWVPEEE